MRKKTTLALVLMMNLACAMAQKSGTTGPLSWNYNETSKELTITGNGAMPNYDYGAAPWQEYQEGIETVNVGSGVTSIGNNAFCNCIYMTTLSLPAGMETIGDNAFSYCLSITSAELPGTITKIGESAPLRDAPAWRASLCQRNWRPSADSPSPTAWPWLAWTSPPT